ncbi:MAG: hypothetical protein DBX63_11970 [Clostridia bacterium]|jgi:hypothetical protein|nr:MAG: hypothetical protein DBX63_11970 [Clostridia bacterium]
MPRENDLTGCRFGMLTAVEKTEQRENRSIVWRCKCSCGGETMVSAKNCSAGRLLTADAFPGQVRRTEALQKT